ncbi:MAG: tetratricopeptide repeat protein [Candidatus Coatesbacteria bacterium]|nr:tetratricopeptide repeat protein [Candidatus Coatesbacteria bacterium]
MDRAGAEACPYDVPMRLWVGIGLFVLAFFTYLFTLCPTIYVGDSGELIAAASCLGIAHPPGYPIFVLLIRLFCIILPFGSLAARCGLVSVISGAAAVFVLFRICLLISTTNSSSRKSKVRSPQSAIGRPFSTVGSAIAAVAFTFSLTFWSQTTIAEVYALTLLFILLMLYLVLKWEQQPEEHRDHRLLLLAAFLGGLGMSSHHTVALLLAALTVYVLCGSPRLLLKANLVVPATALGILGALVHLYLAVRASTNPALNWGTPDAFTSFVNHILRREYGSSNETARSLALLLRQAWFYIYTLARQFTPVGFLLSALGLAVGIRRRNRALLLLAATFLSCSLFFILYTNFRLIPRDTYLVEVFFIPSFAVAAIFLCLGASFVLEVGKRKKDKGERGQENPQSTIRNPQSAIVAGALGLLVCAVPLLANYFYNDKSRHFLTYDYGVNILKSMPSDNSIVFVDRDMEVFTLLFLKDVERICPDIEMIDRSGILRRDFYAKDIRLMSEQQRQVAQLQAEHRLFRRVAQSEVEQRSICYVPGVDLGDVEEFKLKPVGVTTVLVSAALADEFSDWERDVPKLLVNRSIDDPNLFKDYTSRCVAMVWQLQLGDSYYWQGDHEEGERLWRASSETADDIMILHNMLAEKAVKIGLTDLAIEEYAKIARLRPDDHLVQMNLGFLLTSKGDHSGALQAYERAIQIKPDFSPALKAAIDIYLEQQDFERAIALASRICALAPRDAESLLNLGVLHERAGHYREALGAYERAVAVNPTFAPAYADIGLLQARMGNTEAAKQAMGRALALDPSLAASDMRLQESGLAAALIDENQASQTESFAGLSSDELRSRIQDLVAAKQLPLAIKAYKRLTDLAPDDSRALVGMGILLDQAGSSGEAQAAFKKALSIDPSSADAHNALGVVYAKRKDYRNARREWEAALALKPDSAGTLSNLKQLEQLGY